MRHQPQVVAAAANQEVGAGSQKDRKESPAKPIRSANKCLALVPYDSTFLENITTLLKAADKAEVGGFMISR